MKKLTGILILLSISFFVNAIETAEPGMLVLNEISSTGDYDFIELYNTTDRDLLIGPQWSVRDRIESRSDNDKAVTFVEGTVIEAKGYILIAPYKTSGLLAKVPEEIPDNALAVRSFAIGSKDEISLLYDGELVDYISWQSDVNSIGRIPDGSETLSVILIPTPGEPNEAELLYYGDSPIVINEVCSRGLDYIELLNVSGEDLFIAKNAWKLEDSRKNDYVFLPEGLVFQDNALLVVYPDVTRLPFSAVSGSVAAQPGLKFGLGNSDSVYLKYYDMIVDYFVWSDHVTSMGRFPDGSETIDYDLYLTPGKPNRD